MDHPDHHHPAPEEPCGEPRDRIASPGTASQQLPELAAADMPLFMRMKDALAAPTSRRQRNPSRKPTAREIVTLLQPQLAALRAGTAPACNGQRMTWREIADRLASMTGLSADSLRKAWVTRTSERRRTTRRAQGVAAAPTSETSGLMSPTLSDTPNAAAKVVGPSSSAFGPLFDD